MLLNCGVGEDSWESLGLWGEQSSHPKGNQPWIFIGRTDAEAEAPILWPPEDWLIGKDPDAGKDWGQKEKGVTDDEMVGWHHWLNGRKFEQTVGDSKRQGSLAGCSPWGLKESDMTEHRTTTTNVTSATWLNLFIFSLLYQKWDSGDLNTNPTDGCKDLLKCKNKKTSWPSFFQ